MFDHLKPGSFDILLSQSLALWTQRLDLCFVFYSFPFVSSIWLSSYYISRSGEAQCWFWELRISLCLSFIRLRFSLTISYEFVSYKHWFFIFYLLICDRSRIILSPAPLFCYIRHHLSQSMQTCKDMVIGFLFWVRVPSVAYSDRLVIPDVQLWCEIQ